MFRCLARRASAASFASLDAIGIPTNWYNATTFTNLTWQNSRKFASLKKGTATYSTAVIEVGYNICHSRTGLSLVMDFNGGDNDTYELYRRSGITTSSGVGAAYSTGLVENYHGQGDYSGTFVSISGSANGYGLDYCQSPFEKPGEGARATTVTQGDGTMCCPVTLGLSLGSALYIGNVLMFFLNN